jgi:hypothetical protein
LHLIVRFAALSLAAILLSCPLRAQAVTGRTLERVPKAVLLEVLANAGLDEARVTSVARTPRQQAAAMRGVIERDGAAATRARYHSASHVVIDEYERSTGAGDSATRTLDLMEEAVSRVIERLGPQRTTMMHVAGNSYTFDVAPSSIRNPSAFEDALRAHPNLRRVIVPGPAEAAFHIEVPRSASWPHRTFAVELGRHTPKQGKSVDWYIVESDANAVLAVSVASTAFEPVVMVVREPVPAARPLAQTERNGGSADLSYRLSSGGRYWVGVLAGGAIERGTYRLTISLSGRGG